MRQQSEAASPIKISLFPRESAIGPNGPKHFPAAGPAVADFLIDFLFRPWQCDAGVITDGLELRCGRYPELKSSLQWSERAHYLLPQLNHHSCARPGYGAFVTRLVEDNDERDWLRLCCSDPSAMIEFAPDRHQYVYALSPWVEPETFDRLDDALGAPGLWTRGFEHGAGLLILPSGTLNGFRTRLVEFSGVTFTLEELVRELGARL